MERPYRVIVDTDGGVDGALTLMYALLAPHIEVDGVVASPGAVGAAQAADNALRLIRLCGAEGLVPVAVGEGCGPLPPLRDREAAAGGRNGLAGALLAPSAQRPLAEPAAAFLVRRANEAPGELALVIAAAPTQWRSRCGSTRPSPASSASSPSPAAPRSFPATPRPSPRRLFAPRPRPRRG